MVKGSDFELIKQKHQDIFGEKPELIIHAPGRVNLIGEHTDYSEGYVMPIAINMGITLGISRVPESETFAVYSIDYDSKRVVSYSNIMKSDVDWFNYPLGVIKILQKKKYKFEGIRISFTGNVPQGAGLSSSAALEVAVAFAIKILFKLKIDDLELAKICQQAEHEIVGVKCGIMDQYISIMGKQDAALFIDCRTLKSHTVPLKIGSAKFIITNSNVPHKLSSSKYNDRVQECAEAVKILNIETPGTALRDYTIENFEKLKAQFSENVAKRALHVISENQRVLEAEIALKNRNLQEFGKLLNDSHYSLRDNYEVSSPELDWLTDAARTTPGCYGSRLTGAGFGGCTVTLIENKSIQKYYGKLKDYTEKFGYQAVTYEINATNGVGIIKK
ncbi:MAG: galactokinase [Promethearchaeota archaeon]